MWTVVRNNLSFEYTLIMYIYILNLIGLNVEDYFLYFYLVKGCGNFGLNVLFIITFHKIWSIFVSFLYRFYHLFWKFWIPGSSIFLLLYFFQKYVSCGKHFQDFSCYVLFSNFLLGSRFPNTGVSCVVFKNFASRLKRWQFLVFFTWFYNIWGFGEIIFYA